MRGLRFCMERSLEMVISIMGVLKAGGAYVPLDPGYPSKKRLSYMLEDTGGDPVLLTQSEQGRGQLGREMWGRSVRTGPGVGEDLPAIVRANPEECEVSGENLWPM